MLITVHCASMPWHGVVDMCSASPALHLSWTANRREGMQRSGEAAQGHKCASGGSMLSFCRCSSLLTGTQAPPPPHLTPLQT